MPFAAYRIAGETIAAITSPEYRKRLQSDVLASGIRLLLSRRRRNPDYPFPDTKFNPNTGEDYPPTQYDEHFTWFLGRGSESCSKHLSVLDSLVEFSAEEREEAREMLTTYVRNQNRAILDTLESNEGRIPFRVNREMKGVGANGRLVSLSPDGCNASELFCAKALLAGGQRDEVEAGVRLFERFIGSALENGYEDDTAGYSRNLHAEGPFMLSFAAFEYLLGLAAGTGKQDEWITLAAKLFDYVLDRFYDSRSRRFYELIDFSTRERQAVFLPGHACELVGLGLQALRAIDRLQSAGRENSQPDPGHIQAFQRARRELPHILFTSYEMGYDHEHGGMYQSVDPMTGTVINNDLPWWCLPEAMRAAAHALAIASEGEARRRLAEIFVTSSNDYFENYPNEGMFLFPFRTRSGDTGEVKNLMPVVPEADPLYHTNLAVIDVIDVLAGLSSSQPSL